jgi:hypothetical protein
MASRVALAAKVVKQVLFDPWLFACPDRATADQMNRALQRHGGAASTLWILNAENREEPLRNNINALRAKRITHQSGSKVAMPHRVMTGSGPVTHVVGEAGTAKPWVAGLRRP